MLHRPDHCRAGTSICTYRLKYTNYALSHIHSTCETILWWWKYIEDLRDLFWAPMNTENWWLLKFHVTIFVYMCVLLVHKQLDRFYSSSVFKSSCSIGWGPININIPAPILRFVYEHNTSSYSLLLDIRVPSNGLQNAKWLFSWKLLKRFWLN